MTLYVAECIKYVNERCKVGQRFVCIKEGNGNVRFADLYGKSVTKTQEFAREHFKVVTSCEDLFATTNETTKSADKSVDATPSA